MAAGDFNNDGKLDLIFLTDYSIGVMLGNGDGTFQAPINLSTSQANYSVGIGDFNRDGKLDLVVGKSLFQVQIYLGNGDGTFKTGDIYDVAEDPNSVAVADFRGNGMLDLAVGCEEGIGVSVLLGNGDGTFQEAVSYPTPGAAAWVAAGDLNGDGKPDLAVANFGLPISPITQVSVYLGNGDGTFQPATNYPSGRENTYIAIADFNNDKQLDLIAIDSLGNDGLVLLNTGVVSLSPTTPRIFPPQLLNTDSDELAVKLTNTGITPLTISSITAQGEFKVSDNCGGSVKAGAECSISIRSEPTTQGTLTGTVTIQDSASSKPQVIELSGAGTVVELMPSGLTFPAQEVNTKSRPQQVELKNTGSVPLTISNVYVQGPNWTSFLQTNNCGNSIPAGGKCRLLVTFDPVKTGPLQARLDVYDSGGGTFQTTQLSGTGD